MIVWFCCGRLCLTVLFLSTQILDELGVHPDDPDEDAPKYFETDGTKGTYYHF